MQVKVMGILPLEKELENCWKDFSGNKLRREFTKALQPERWVVGSCTRKAIELTMVLVASA